MGIVKKQAVYNSIFNYVGQFIGYVNVILLFPILLNQDEFGLTRLLGSLSIVFAQLSSFGSQRIIIKFFPFFKSEDSRGHNGFLTIILGLILGCFLIVSCFFFLFENFILSNQDSELVQRFYFVIPSLALLTLLTWVLDAYLKVLYKSSLPSFLNNVVVKLLWLLSVALYYWGVIDFFWFIVSFCSVQLITVIVMVIYLLRINQLYFILNRKYLRWRLLKHILKYGANSILDDTNVVVMNNIDKIMIGFMMNLESLAVYSVASYLSTVISIPNSSLYRILVPMISTHWKKKQRDKVVKLYQQSTSLGLVLGGSMFVLIWANIDSILSMIDNDYVSGVYVILFLMLARMVDLAFGLNNDIILVSKHYWFNTLSGIVLVLLIVVFNLIFIPIYGFTGAAFGTLLAKLIFNLIKYLFLKQKEKLDPFRIANLKGVVVLVFVLGLSYIIHIQTQITFLNLIVNGTMDAILLFGLLYLSKASDDINEVVDKQMKKIRKWL